MMTLSVMGLAVASCVFTAAPNAEPDLRAKGAFDFPQAEATVLCDTPALRLSVWNDAAYVYAQAVVWEDHDDALGLTSDGRKIGDWSNLMLDVDGDGKDTAKVDRSYSLDPWPGLTGLHYSVVVGDGATTGLQGDSKGHGCIRYVGEAKVRVDSFVIPLEEIGKKPGDSLRMAYWGSSAKPELVVNSVGFSRDGKPYYSHHIPRGQYHDVRLADRPASLAIDQVPEGREQIVVKAKGAMPAVGSEPPEISAGVWANWSGKEPPTLKSLRGKVVVVEFWATWCGPCVAGIPHLIELHQNHASEGMVLLSLTDQAHEAVEKFVKDKGMIYAVGMESETADAYGVTGIPHAFVIGKDGKLVWEGHPAQEEFEGKVKEALKAP